ATLGGAPLAGYVGEPLRNELRRVPRGAGLPAPGSTRSPGGDLASLGRYLAATLAPWLPDGHPVRAMADELATGTLRSAAGARARLEAAAPARMEHFQALARPPRGAAGESA
ncbi:MAG TPA: hypothetical protein VFJ82_15095, partial [Longimicrobium sp.]|nr:hypothetical protein [Longimicrobium sp.]